jgi:hypothetical protein
VSGAVRHSLLTRAKNSAGSIGGYTSNRRRVLCCMRAWRQSGGRLIPSCTASNAAAQCHTTLHHPMPVHAIVAAPIFGYSFTTPHHTALHRAAYRHTHAHRHTYTHIHTMRCTSDISSISASCVRNAALNSITVVLLPCTLSKRTSRPTCTPNIHHWESGARRRGRRGGGHDMQHAGATGFGRRT